MFENTPDVWDTPTLPVDCRGSAVVQFTTVGVELNVWVVPAALSARTADCPTGPVGPMGPV